jgi:hypothetical protein
MKKIFASTILVSALIFDLVNTLFNNPVSQEVISLYKAEPATITAIITTIIVTAISYILAPTPKKPRFGSTDENKGILVNKDSNNNPIPVVYGKRQVGLTRVYVESSGTDNQYLYIAGVLCEGGGKGIESIDEIYVDDKLVVWSGALTDGTVRTVGSTDTNFYKESTSLISVQGFYGLDNQSASSLLQEQANWTSNHKLSGLAYLALRFKWNQDAFSGIPEVRVTLKGKKIYDPRLDSTKGGSGSHREDTASTWAYSTNSSLILLDYLRNARYGKGLPNSAFQTNYDSFKTSANTCETQVTPYTSGTNINLFETHAVLDSEKKVIDNVRELLVPMRAIFNYTQGTYKLIIEGTGSSQLLLTKDNVVSEVKLQGENKSEKYNRVVGTFTNPEKDYQADTVSYPPYDDSALAVEDQHATMLSADNNTLLERSFDMTHVTSPYQAEEICENILKRSRNCLKAEVTVTSEALNLAIGDIVTATYDTAGFSAKPFRVMSLSINADSTVNLGLEEHQDNFYTWESKSQAPTIADTVLPNPFSVSAPASVTLGDQLIQYSDGVVITALDVTIGASPDNFVDYYQVEYKLSTDATYQVSGQVKGLNHRILNVIDGLIYNVRVKAFNTLGVQSSYASATRTIVGGTALPSDVEDFACNIVGQDAHLSWKQIPDLDLAYYTIRYSTLTANATWINSVTLVEKVARPATSVTVPARVGSYLIKAVDKAGNLSVNEAIISTSLLAVGNFNAVTTQTESPTFTGTKTNLTLSGGELRLTSLASEGIYLFSAPIDLGGTYTSRVTATITQYAEDPTDLFDSGRGFTLFDDATGSFDGNAPAFTNSHLEIATSADNITYTSFRNFVVGDYTARYYKFRMRLTSLDGVSTPVITALSVTVDMPDRIFSGNDITSGTGTYSVTFTLPFYSANYAVGITAQGMATGDYFLLTSKSTTGFNVAFKNSSGTGISKSFDYICKGF